MSDDFQIEDDEDPFARRTYEVGYGKPPKQHQFKRGNKAAAGTRRRRADTRVQQLADKLLKEKLVVTIEGKRIRMSRMEMILRSTIQQCAKSPKDALRLLSWAMEHEPEAPPSWLEQKIKVEFVNRGTSADPLPEDPQGGKKPVDE